GFPAPWPPPYIPLCWSQSRTRWDRIPPDGFPQCRRIQFYLPWSVLPPETLPSQKICLPVPRYQCRYESGAPHRFSASGHGMSCIVEHTHLAVLRGDYLALLRDYGCP